MTEQEKYEAMWKHPSYRAFSPGGVSVPKFLEVANPKPGETLRDLGCGTGRAGSALQDAGLEVTQYDFASNCRDPGIELPFVQHDLMNIIPGLPADYAFCCDVLEHIPIVDVPRVLRHVVIAGKKTFLQISCIEDHCGKVIGEELHLTVKPYEWWKEQLEAFECDILWSEESEGGRQCSFLVSAYAYATDFPKHCVINVTHEVVDDNVRKNLRGNYAEVGPHLETDTPLMILAGGPTLLDFKDEIIERRKAGELLVTVNNTHEVCYEWGIEPSMQIMCDAREFNLRFVAHPFPRTKYLISSQCHPSIAASLPKDQVLMWHSGLHCSDLIDEYNAERGEYPKWYPISGGGTVMLRAVPLLCLLGYRFFEFFGYDNCLRVEDGKTLHHAYPQPENDRIVEIGVSLGGRTFQCHPWMVAQVGDWMNQLKVLGPHVRMSVRGDSLTSWIFQHAAQLDS